MLLDSRKYPRTTPDGRFPAWWENYLRDEGFDSCLCSLNGLHALADYGGNVLGILRMDIPSLRAAHVVAVDEIGVVDPADNAPDHVPLLAYVLNRANDGVVFHDEWLAVRKPSLMRLIHSADQGGESSH